MENPADKTNSKMNCKNLNHLQIDQSDRSQPYIITQAGCILSHKVIEILVS